jgi:hypothetical protein
MAGRPWMVLDIATAPIDNAGDFIAPASEREAPANYKDPVKIEAAKKESFERDRLKAATDIDLAQLTGLVAWTERDGCVPAISGGDPEVEKAMLLRFAAVLKRDDPVIITYNGLAFDLPFLQRRCRYVGVDLRWINTDRYRTEHIDLYHVLTQGGKLRAHPLSWYVKRLGWSDLSKTLTGEQESRILVEDREPNITWPALYESLLHDAVAVARLCTWLGLGQLPHMPTPPVEPHGEAPIL